MGSKSKSTRVVSAARLRGAKARAKQARSAAVALEVWEQSAQMPDERDDELDCQRIVQGDGRRGLPPYYDDYN